MNEATPKTETEEIHLLYLGVAIYDDGKLHHRWTKVTQEQFEEGDLPEEVELEVIRYEGKSPVKYMADSPGCVYKVPKIKGTESIYSSQARYQGLWPNQERRTVWQANSRTEQTSYDLRKAAEKAGREDDFAVLKPFRERYKKLVSRNQRAALLAQVIAYITG